MEGGEGSHERGRTDPTYNYRCSRADTKPEPKHGGGKGEDEGDSDYSTSFTHSFNPVLYSVPSLNWGT